MNGVTKTTGRILMYFYNTEFLHDFDLQVLIISMIITMHCCRNLAFADNSMDFLLLAIVCCMTCTTYAHHSVFELTHCL